MTNFWAVEPEKKIQELTQLWMDGLSASSVAERLSRLWSEPVTRSVVLGKLHRLNLPRNSRITRLRPKPRSYKPRAPYARASQRQAVHGQAAIIRAARMEQDFSPLREPWVTDPAIRKPFTQVADIGECKWVYDPGRAATCCARATIPGLSWCREHMDIVFSAPTPRQTQPTNTQSERALETA